MGVLSNLRSIYCKVHKNMLWTDSLPTKVKSFLSDKNGSLTNYYDFGLAVHCRDFLVKENTISVNPTLVLNTKMLSVWSWLGIRSLGFDLAGY